MASYTSAWLVGSARDLSFTSFTIAGNTSVAISGDLYLWHDTDSLSLVDLFAAQMTAAGVGSATAVITRDRRVKISGDATFVVQWNDDTTLRDLLGFTGNLSGAAAYTATDVSPLLWSPGKPLLPGLSPLDCHGNRRPLSYFTASPSDGSTFVVSHGTRTDQQWSASSVATSRIQTPDELGGEWAVFFEQSAALGYNFMVYPEVTEESGSSTAATPLSTPLGPYSLAPSGRAASWDFKRSNGFQYLNRRNEWAISCRVVPEYS